MKNQLCSELNILPAKLKIRRRHDSRRELPNRIIAIEDDREVLDLAKHLEYLNIDEEQVLRLAQSFKSLNIDQRREIEGDLFRKCPSHLQTQLRKIHDLVLHISQCRTPRCQYPYCGKVKGFIRHGLLCKTRAAGGCQACKKMWHILQHYSRACKESNCNIPFCSDLKECWRRPQKQSDSRRGAAKVADCLNFKGTPEQMRKLHDLVVHISQCRTPRCQYPYCGKLKGFIRHGVLCKTHAAGGCHLCKKMWRILRHCSRACIESNCNAPLCSDLKECRRKAQKQSDSRRRTAKVADSKNFKGTPEQLRKILDLVVHISRCPSACCLYLNCGKAKGLFHHSSLCKTRAAGGCHECKKLWHILWLHAEACKESNCNVPRCRDLKEHLLLSDLQRWAAVEVDCSS